MLIKLETPVFLKKKEPKKLDLLSKKEMTRVKPSTRPFNYRGIAKSKNIR